MPLRGTQYTVTAVATQPFPGNNATPRIQLQEISFKGPSANSGSVFLGNSNVTTTTNRLIEVAAGTGFTTGPFDNGPVYLDDFYVVGTNADVLFIYYVAR